MLALHTFWVIKFKTQSFHLFYTYFTGFETAKALALHGAHVILACRNINKANKAAAIIRAAQVCSLVLKIMHPWSTVTWVLLLLLWEFCKFHVFLQKGSKKNLFVLHIIINTYMYWKNVSWFQWQCMDGVVIHPKALTFSLLPLPILFNWVVSMRDNVTCAYHQMKHQHICTQSSTVADNTLSLNHWPANTDSMLSKR